MAKMLIGGELVDAQGGKTIEVRNPANGEVVGQIPRGTTADVDAAVDAAKKAFPGWAATPGSKRAKLMHEAALKMHEVVDEVAKLLAMEQGKPLAHAKIEAQRVAENLEYFAGLADKIRGDYIPLDDPSKFGITIRRPVGVVVAITPWNFPLTLFANKLCPALATGCTIVLKPASTTPLATQRAIEAINSVQACLAVKRIFLFDKIAEEFMTKFTERAQKEWKIGEQFAADTKMGPLHTEHQRAEVEAQVADAVNRGAKVLAGGKRPDGAEYAKGWFYPATVLTDVPEDSRMATEEVFGPAVPLFIVKDLDEAIAKANSSIYGLGSSIFTRDMAKARKAAEQLDAGYTWVNDIQFAYDQLPFGGAKQSGFGKEHGIEALESYTEKKSVVLAG